jgi:hypothetical protein
MTSVFPMKGNSDVALDAVKRWCGMVLETGVGAGVIDDERRDRAADGRSIRRGQLELVAWLHSETRVVEDRAGRP